MKTRTLPLLTLALVAPLLISLPPAAAPAATYSYWCVQPGSPWGSYREFRLPLPHKCNAGYVIAKAADGVNQQLITVAATSYGTSYAQLTAFDWSGSRWKKAYGPYPARIGAGGMATPGAKIEGKPQTPQGTYGFSFFFGVLANPGVSFPYRRAHTYDVWDDDPASPLYNEWVDTRVDDPGLDPEPLHNVPVYNYAAVIAYNTARTPGAGSAIFLHVGDGSATAGCVSLRTARLLTILRWLQQPDQPLIAMRVVAS